MKLVDFKCPGCGAQLSVDVDLRQATCPYCSKTFPIDDEVQYVKLDGAAQAGYEFEKGRQQAQAEFAAQQQPQTVYVNVQAEQPKKRKTWLWVLGWIFIFPVPLTILMLKNEKMDKKVRYGIIAAGWIVYLLIAFAYGGSNNQKKDADTGSSSSTVTAVQSSGSSAASGDSSASSEADGPTKDSVVNEFIASYNAISASPIESTEQGNIRTKYFTYSYGYYLELLHANDTDKIVVKINETNENADVGVPGMRDVFHDAAKAIDPSLTDDDIYGFFDRACEDPANRGDQVLGSIAIFWSHDVDLSSGHSRGRIDLSAQ